MLSCQSQSDARIRRFVSLVTQICLSDEFGKLKEELACTYAESGEENPDVVAFEDALYTMMLQLEEQVPDLKEIFAHL